MLDLEFGALRGAIVERKGPERAAEWKYVLLARTIDSVHTTVVVAGLPAGKVAVRTVSRLRRMPQRKRLCDFCGRSGTRVRRSMRSYGRAPREFLVRNIPTINRPLCGETYLTADTLKLLERIKADHGRVAVKRSIAVADFQRAARRRAS